MCNCDDLEGYIKSLKKDIQDLQYRLGNQEKCLETSRNNVYDLTIENEALKKRIAMH